MTPFDLRCWELLGVDIARPLADFLIGAHKFLASSGAWQTCWQAGNELIEQRLFRLPYNDVVFEFSEDIPYSTSRIVFACHNLPTSIGVVPFIKYKSHDWVGGTKYHLILHQHADRQPEWVAGSAYARFDAPGILRGNQLMIADILTATVAMISIPGAVTEDVIVPSKLANAREKRGHLPLFSYRVVTLGIGGGSRQDHGGTHASPALHWRRGHFRRLGPRLISVAPCLVGSAENGIIEKSYDGRELNRPPTREEYLAVR